MFELGLSDMISPSPTFSSSIFNGPWFFQTSIAPIVLFDLAEFRLLFENLYVAVTVDGAPNVSTAALFRPRLITIQVAKFTSWR